MLRTPQEHIDSIIKDLGEYTKDIFAVIALALVVGCIVGLICWHSGQVDRAVEIYGQELGQKILIEQLPMRMK